MAVKSYKFRLYPNRSEVERLGWVLEQCRLTYNRLLEELGKQEHPDRKALSALLPKWKAENPELKSVYSKCLQPEVDRLFHNLRSLAELKKLGYKVGPLRFKGQHWFKTFTYNQLGFKIIRTDNRLSILWLSKIGDIPMMLHRPVEGTVKQVTVKRMGSGKWYAFVQADDGKKPPEKAPLKKVVGIDVGLTEYVVDSDGLHVENPRWLKRSLKKLRREQRRLSRKKKGSKNQVKQDVRVARLHERVENQRDDFLHKLSRHYVDDYDLIATEDLDVKGLVEQGRLSGGIMDASWSKFNWMVSYKAVNAGKTYVQVEPRGTSQECSRCGAIVVKSLHERVHRCPKCGLVIGRDDNSSINILKRGCLKVGREPPEHTPAETRPLPCTFFDSHQENARQVGAMNQETPRESGGKSSYPLIPLP